MEKERLIKIMISALDNELCKGCETSLSPYAYENGGSCDECSHMAAIEIASIIRKDTQTADAVSVEHIKELEQLDYELYCHTGKSHLDEQQWEWLKEVLKNETD